MEQVFWLELHCPPETEVQVAAPEGVKLLDKTKPGKGRARTRLYFRSDRGIEHGVVTARLDGGASVEVPLRVLTYRQDIEQRIKEVPGVDPSVRKRGRSYYTDDMIALARRNLEDHPSLRKDLERPTWYDEMSDEEVFASLPSWNVPRQCYSNWPCPECGERIYEFSGYYPWERLGVPRFKLRCPICKQLFPSNDFANDDFTSGAYPDDGWGWDPGSGKREDFAGWVAHTNHFDLFDHFTSREGLAGELLRLAHRALLLGDEEAAHKVGLVCARMAYVYPGMNMRWQQVDTHYLRRGRLLLDGSFERNGILIPVARAYDAVFELLDGDTRLAQFLRTKDPAIKSPADVKALIDTYLIQVFGWDWMRRELSGGRMGHREKDMADFAVCADMGPISERWIRELFTHAWNSGADKGGFDDEAYINTTTREGPVWIAALGYAQGYLESKSDMAEILSRVTSPRWRARCNLYDEKRYPKFRAEFDTWIDFVVAGRFGPCYGDDGGGRTMEFPKGIPTRLRTAYERAYRRWPTDRLARAIYRLGKRDPALFEEEDIWPRVEAQATKAGPEPPLESRVMDGVGFVFLESRAHAKDRHDRAGIALRYGYGGGHAHHDNLNIEMFAKGRSVSPELGYPTWAHPMGDTGHVAHHNTGMIDRSPQYQHKGPTLRVNSGELELFAGATEASFAQVSARPDGFPNRIYRRAVCLADAPGGNVYLVDILRMAGGTVRTCCFHGPGDDIQSNLRFEQEARAPEADEAGCQYMNNIVEPQIAVSDNDAWMDWEYQDKGARLRLLYLGKPGRRYITARCAKPDIPPVRYLFAEEEQEDGASEFISIWQPYEGKPFVEKVVRLPVQGETEPGEFRPVALRVVLAGGQEDTFLYSHDPNAEVRVGDLEFKGSFGYWSELDGQPRALHLVNGERLRKGEHGVSDAPPSFRAQIARVDLHDRILTLDRKLPENQDWKGHPVFIRGGTHRTAYHLVEVLPSGNVVKLDLDSIIFRSRIMGVAEDGTHLVTEISPPIEVAGGFKPGYYNGAVLTGEDLKARYRVSRVEDDRIYTDRPVVEADFPDLDGDGRRMVCIHDLGAGDEVTVYRSLYRTTPA